MQQRHVDCRQTENGAGEVGWAWKQPSYKIIRLRQVSKELNTPLPIDIGWGMV